MESELDYRKETLLQIPRSLGDLAREQELNAEWIERNFSTMPAYRQRKAARILRQAARDVMNTINEK